MLGIWKGKYRYNLKRNTEFNNKEVDFTVEIQEFDGEKFTGTVQDHDIRYGTRGIGKIEGKWINDKIEFIKLMPVKSVIIGNEKERIEFENEKHDSIYYSGTDISNNSFAGTWKIKGGICFRNKQLYISFGTKGIWEMSKV